MPSVENTVCGLDWQAFVYMNVFLACSSFSCALPTIEPYLSKLGALGIWAYAVAIYSVGQFIASPIWGYLCSRHRSEYMLYASLTIGVVGGVLYGTARSGVEVLTARLLIGLYTGSQEACHRTIVVRCTSDNDRTIAQAGVSTATVLGFLFGPAFAGLFIFQPIGPFNILGVPILIDSFTGPGWLIVLFCFVSSFFVTVGLTQEQTAGLPQFRMQEPEVPVIDEDHSQNMSKISYRSFPVNTSEAQKNYNAIDGDNEGKLTPKDAEPVGRAVTERNSKLPDGECEDPDMPTRYAGIIICGMVLFVNALGFSAYETITTPLVENDFGWDLFYADMLFVAAGIVCILVFIVIRFTSATVEDRYLLLCGVVFSTVGYGLMLEFFDNRLPLPRFLLGFAAVNAAMELNRSVTMSLASKILPPTSRYQGLLQGFLISCVACARIIGPMYAVWVWNATDRDKFSQGHWVFVGLFISFLFTTIIYVQFFSSLQTYRKLVVEWQKKELAAPLLSKT
mmetsp:Transcript_7521/g.11387  ORF Transcript_7521/g.11387 Transcript_7521/m.11387 type:complete len:508 (-) Transcript_7521:217-1740(-)